jgi:hypothetical protein
MAQPCAIVKYTVADDATALDVATEEGLVPVAVYAAAWTPASFTLQLPTSAPGKPGDSTTFKSTDDAAVTLTDDTWVTFPVAMARKCAGTKLFRLLFNAAESGGPITAQIAWATPEVNG